MITPSFGLTATERVLPKLALDFTTASLDSRVTFTRTTGASNPATYVNSSGVVTTAINNQPRFDYDPVTLACKGLLIEESRINVQPYSNDFSQAAVWTNVRSSLGATTVVSPDGTQNVTKLIEDGTASNTHLLISDLVLASNVYSYSIYAKAGERTQIGMFCAASADFSVFDLSSGTITVTGSETPTITPAGNGWYRCSIKTGATTTPVRIAIANSNVISYSGNGSSGIYVWGAQIEAGAFATSYIPTTTAALTRNADVATMTGTNFSDWWTATTGAAVVRAEQMSVTSIRPWVQFDDNTANNIIAFRGNTTNPEFYVKATTDQATIDAGMIAAKTNYGLGAGWNTNNCAAALSGASVITDTSATIPTVTQARLGSDGTNYLTGWLQSVRYWPQRLINAEIQAFSK